MSSSEAVALRWALRVAMLLVALISFVFALWLEAELTSSSTEVLAACYLSGQPCWDELLGEAVAFTAGAVLFVLLPVVLEPKEKFSVAVVFYSIGASIVALGVLLFGRLGFAELWPMVFPPLLAGLGCVIWVGRAQGYGAAAQLFTSSAPPFRSVRRWAVLRRFLIVPLIFGSVLALMSISERVEDRLFALWLPAAYYPGNDSVPESCSNPLNERLRAFSDHATTAVQMALAVGLAALLEPRFKRLAARLVWLVGCGFIAWLAVLLVFTAVWQRALLAFVVGAFCVRLVGHYTGDAEGFKQELS